jgi:hypothetical protein
VLLYSVYTHDPAIACRLLSRIHGLSSMCRLQGSDMPTCLQRPACNFSQSSGVITQWPGNRSANMVHRTSPGRCLEDLQPCFIHMRQNARSDDVAAVDRYGKRLLHLVFSERSHHSPAPADCLYGAVQRLLVDILGTHQRSPLREMLQSRRRTSLLSRSERHRKIVYEDCF